VVVPAPGAFGHSRGPSAYGRQRAMPARRDRLRLAVPQRPLPARKRFVRANLFPPPPARARQSRPAPAAATATIMIRVSPASCPRRFQCED
jgi:hypothetical protein